MTPDEVRTLIRQHESALAARDAVGAAAHHAEDGVVETPSTGIHTGRAEIQRGYEQWFVAFPDFQFEVQDLVVDKDRAAAVFRITGTHRADFLEFAPTGKHVEFTGVMILKFKDGQIAHDRRVYDFRGFLVKLGVLKVKPA